MFFHSYILPTNYQILFLELKFYVLSSLVKKEIRNEAKVLFIQTF